MKVNPLAPDSSAFQVFCMNDIFARLSVLAEPTRARLLRVLECEELGVGELANVVQLPQSTVSRHLKVLHGDGWLDRRKDGTASLFRVALDLPVGASALWPAVRGQAQELWADEDDLRMRAVIAARHVDSATWFGRMAEHWDGVRQDLFGVDFTFSTLLSLVPDHWTVLDLGCGTGAVVAQLALGVREVIGVDRERAMLEAAVKRCDGLGNVRLHMASLDALPLEDDSVDAALCMLVLHHQALIGSVLNEARRVLRPGGRLVVLDMVEHERSEYRQSMGHHHLGFSELAVFGAFESAGLRPVSYRRLAAQPEARGPGLFVAIAKVSAEET
ncbi:MAG: ubiquinone/menaquinone biosynthesis C-methylase UbiE [Kiritimatiellia bacterium]|jgi:ubiquinone/menaquinone biosynthesis C-methylase UbiE/DNA-binding transcriptional ArsR family regulator